MIPQNISPTNKYSWQVSIPLCWKLSLQIKNRWKQRDVGCDNIYLSVLVPFGMKDK